MLYLLIPHLCFFIVFNLDLFVNRDDSLTSLRLSCEPNNQLHFCTTSVTEDEVGALKLVLASSNLSLTLPRRFFCCGSYLLDYIYQSCMLHEFVITWLLFSWTHCPLHFICSVQASTVTTLLQQLLTLLSVTPVQCLVYILNTFMLIFCIVLFYFKRVTSDIEVEVGTVKLV